MEAERTPIFKRGPSLFVRLVFFAVLSVVLMFADARLKYLEEIRTAVSLALFPFQEAASWPGRVISQTSEFFVTQSLLVKDNERLKRENFLKAQDLQKLDALKAENAQLLRMIQAKPAPERERTFGQVLYESRDPITRKIVIDKGSDHNLKEGLPVVDDLGLIGQITRVFPFVAEVSLITDKNQSIPVQNVRTGWRSVTFGKGQSNSVELGFVPVNTDVQIGDVLVTSGIDGVYPAGIKVATVTNIERNAAVAFARITCTPTAGTSSFDRVIVLSEGEPKPENTLKSQAPAASSSLKSLMAPKKKP